MKSQLSKFLGFFLKTLITYITFFLFKNVPRNPTEEGNKAEKMAFYTANVCCQPVKLKHNLHMWTSEVTGVYLFLD